MALLGVIHIRVGTSSFVRVQPAAGALFVVILLAGCVEGPTACTWETTPTRAPGLFEKAVARNASVSDGWTSLTTSTGRIQECPGDLCWVSWQDPQDGNFSVSIHYLPDGNQVEVRGPAGIQFDEAKRRLANMLVAGGPQFQVPDLSDDPCPFGVCSTADSGFAVWHGNWSAPGQSLASFEIAAPHADIVRQWPGYHSTSEGPWTLSYYHEVRAFQLAVGPKGVAWLQVDELDIMVQGAQVVGRQGITETEGREMMRQGLRHWALEGVMTPSVPLVPSIVNEYCV